MRQGTSLPRLDAIEPIYEGDQPPTSANRGQNLVEFAITIPVLLLLLLVSVQFALVVMQYYSVMNVTGETTRWLAIRPDTVDADVATYARSRGMTLDPTRYASITTSPSCPVLTGTRCASRNAGDIVSVEIRYDVSSLLFLPITYGFGAMQVSIPQALPPYRVSVMIE